MLTFQSRKFLKMLKLVQMKPDNPIILDLNNMALIPFGGESIKKGCSQELLKYKDCALSVLNYLQKHGYIDFTLNETGSYRSANIRITHSGYHIKEISWRKFFKHVILSIVVPIIVSVITTLVARHFIP